MGMLAVLLLLSGTASGVWAGEPGDWWISPGVGIGEVEVIGHDRSELVTAALAAAGYQTNAVLAGEDDATRTWELGAGYRVARYWGVSMRYYDLGTTDGGFIADVDASAGGPLQGSIQSEYRAVSVAVDAYWPLLSWLSLQGQLGLHHWQHDFHLQGRQHDTGISVAQSISDDGMGILMAAGIGFSVLPWLGFDAAWQRLQGIESEAGVDVKSIRVVFRF